MDVDMTDWSTAADLAAKAGYCPDGSVGEIGVARMAEAEKAAAEWAENVQRLRSMTRGKEKRHVAPECPHCSAEMQWSDVGC